MIMQHICQGAKSTSTTSSRKTQLKKSNQRTDGIDDDVEVHDKPKGKSKKIAESSNDSDLEGKGDAAPVDGKDDKGDAVLGDAEAGEGDAENTDGEEEEED